MTAKLERKDFMTPAEKQAMGNKPRTHQNCQDATNKHRPGKTACEKTRKANK